MSCVEFISGELLHERLLTDGEPTGQRRPLERRLTQLMAQGQRPQSDRRATAERPRRDRGETAERPRSDRGETTERPRSDGAPLLRRDGSPHGRLLFLLSAASLLEERFGAQVGGGEGPWPGGVQTGLWSVITLCKRSITFMMLLDSEEMELRDAIDFPGSSVLKPELT
ncbi:hypothetical protein EYF80_057071 [Liparis tanakae]|uniref:Uncharacterized protein n=1 Tax=Liparis tanakae TaxID=230148 RepID=A0A4Z2EVD5_9TELE|nr:hypothetical protein EYF80_057071 [Liparis tanakae]